MNIDILRSVLSVCFRIMNRCLCYGLSWRSSVVVYVARPHAKVYTVRYRHSNSVCIHCVKMTRCIIEFLLPSCSVIIFPVYPICHYFVTSKLLFIMLMAASVDGHLPCLANCHFCFTCICYEYNYLCLSCSVIFVRLNLASRHSDGWRRLAYPTSPAVSIIWCYSSDHRAPVAAVGSDEVRACLQCSRRQPLDPDWPSTPQRHWYTRTHVSVKAELAACSAWNFQQHRMRSVDCDKTLVFTHPDKCVGCAVAGVAAHSYLLWKLPEVKLADLQLPPGKNWRVNTYSGGKFRLAKSYPSHVSALLHFWCEKCMFWYNYHC